MLRPSSKLHERFAERFRGQDRAHGNTYRIASGKSPKGKNDAKGATKHEPPTLDLWAQHLRGEYGLGIIPIRDDETCFWGAIDIDVYNTDLDAISKKLNDIELPLILCRSKSGGAHLFLFASEALPAELVRGKLMEWAVSLGYSGVEVYPKQTRLAGPMDVGNWINMPYFEAKKTQRYAIYNGKKLSAEAFLDLADIMAVDLETLSTKAAPENEDTKEFLLEAPPCLQSLCARGFGEGNRNNALFNICVYLRKRYGDGDWEQHVDEYNRRYMDPPLGHKEVGAVIKSVNRKAYQYKCNDQPICAACNKQICFTRKFGIGTEEGDPGVVFNGLIKISTSPPVWIIDVNGKRIELATQELKDQGRFHTRCIDELNIWPRVVKPRVWTEVVRGLLQNVSVQEAPPDATPEGLVAYHLEMYTTSRLVSKDRNDLARKRPWRNEDEGKTYFIGAEFHQYLEQQRIRLNVRDLWTILKKIGAGHEFFNIKGKGINTWVVDSFAMQDEDLAIPDMEI